MFESHYQKFVGAIVAGVFCALLVPCTGWSGATDPRLAIGAAGVVAVDGVAVIDIGGVFGFDDALQVDFPVTLLVYQGTHFARFAVGTAPTGGTFAALADGFVAAEIGALEAAGSTLIGSEILAVEPGRLQVTVADTLVDGVVNLVLYVELPAEGGFTSNVYALPVSGMGGGL